MVARAATDLSRYGFSGLMGCVLDVLVNPVGLEEYEGDAKRVDHTTTAK